MKPCYAAQIPKFSACLLLFLSGCIKNSQEENLQTELSALKTEVNQLKRNISDLQRQLKFERTLKGLDEIAILTPAAEGYSTIKFDLGVLTVSIANVVEYANGSKISLKFGNPLASAIDGLKATIDYGEVDEQELPRNDTAKTKDVVFNDSIQPGAWTSVHLVLDGVAPSKLGFVRVRNVHHTGIRLLVNQN